MEKVQKSPNCIEFFETEQEIEQKQIEQDKDFIIADLMQKNKEKYAPFSGLFGLAIKQYHKKDILFLFLFIFS